ncbi:MAG: hypothetical protein LBM06_02105, partial [Prevotellaceae bacterium]|nr:hypothetical protein [Prevotellaceae bacterium]
MKQIFRLLLLCLCLSAVTPSLYSQELTEKEKKEQAKAQARQEKENAKQERKQKKDAKKKEREAKVRARYDAFIQEFEPDSLTTLQVDSFFIAATELKRGGVTVDGMLDVFGKFFGAAGTAAGGATGIKERFYRRADNIFAIMSVIVKRNQLIEMVPQPFFDEEMGVSDTTWVAINRNTGQEFARGEATLLYGVSLAAASGI